MCFVFFFQAEDGIRYDLVTGVQTCALPISRRPRSPPTVSPRRTSACPSGPDRTTRTAARSAATGRQEGHPTASRPASPLIPPRLVESYSSSFPSAHQQHLPPLPCPRLKPRHSTSPSPLRHG